MEKQAIEFNPTIVDHVLNKEVITRDDEDSITILTVNRKERTESHHFNLNYLLTTESMHGYYVFNSLNQLFKATDALLNVNDILTANLEHETELIDEHHGYVTEPVFIEHLLNGRIFSPQTLSEVMDKILAIPSMQFIYSETIDEQVKSIDVDIGDENFTVEISRVGLTDYVATIFAKENGAANKSNYIRFPFTFH